MEVCRNFLNGCCKLGAKCRYAHVAQGSNTAAPASASSAEPKAGAKAKAAPARVLASPARQSQQQTEWILDTGTGNDLCPATQVGVEYSGAPMLLETANGVVPATLRSTVALNSLDEDADCIVLEQTVRALSLGRRCAEHGYSFRWDPWAAEPVFIRPDGVEVPIKVENFVPVVVNSDGKASTRDRRRVHCMPALSTSDEVPEAGAEEHGGRIRHGVHRCFGRHILPPPPKGRADNVDVLYADQVKGVDDDNEEHWHTIAVVETDNEFSDCDLEFADAGRWLGKDGSDDALSWVRRAKPILIARLLLPTHSFILLPLGVSRLTVMTFPQYVLILLPLFCEVMFPYRVVLMARVLRMTRRVVLLWKFP